MKSVSAIASTEPITNTPDRHDVTWLGRVRFDFRAKSVDMRIDGMFITFMSVAPNLVQQLGTAVDTTGVPCEVCQQIKLLGCQGNHPSGDVNLAFFQIDGQAILAKHRRSWPLRFTVQCGAAAKYRAYPGDKLVQGEGLGHIVIRADVQAEYAIRLVGLGCEHQHRCVTHALAYSSTDLQATHTGQTEIENNQSPGAFLSGIEPVAAIVCHYDLIAEFQEVQLQQLCDITLVLNDQD